MSSFLPNTDMKLTMGYYTDPRLLDTFGAVDKLPSLDDEPGAERVKALRTGTYDVPETVLTKSASASVPDGPQLAVTGNIDMKKPLGNRGFSMRELGLEPRTYALKGRCSAN